MESVSVPVPYEIHLWFLFENEVEDESFARCCDRLVTIDERRAVERCLLLAERRRRLLARALVRWVLSRYLDADPLQLCIARNAHGKPELTQTGLASPIQFNISHTEGLILMGAASGRALGVDVECIDRTNPPSDVAETYFSGRESAWLQSLPHALRAEHCYRLWTLKESFLKAEGSGLAASLDRIEFAFPGEGEIEVLAARAQDEGMYQHWLLKPSPVHAAAACCRRGPSRQTLVMRNVVPLERNESFECEVVGRSR